ncbi:MAG TPA: hypothetical protein VKS01_01540 [Bryobacteraceae bacterium]|nr:hypothetical protein [Bryobacteraceae bacterium]
MTDFPALLKALAESKVDYIIVGGMAAIAHGSARMTFDLDIVYGRSSENIRRLVSAIKPSSPYLRGAVPGLPFQFDEKTIERGLNFTLTTNLGQLDLLGEITRGGNYEALLPYAEDMDLFGFQCRCLSLDRLIEVKLAAGRPKDLDSISELRALQAARESTNS